MWRTLISKSHLQRATSTFQRHLESSATSPDPADLIDTVIEPQIQTNDEGYFRSLAQKSSGQCSTNTPSSSDLFNSRFVEKASSFAKEIRSNPGHIKFREGTKHGSQKIDYFARAVAECNQRSNPGNYANKKTSPNQVLIDVERKYERINDQGIFQCREGEQEIESNVNQSSREPVKFEEFSQETELRSEPRNWHQEISQFRTEKKERKLQKKQFFSNEREMNSVHVSQASQYKLNRAKHREVFVKEKRSEFREKFLEFKKSKKSDEIKYAPGTESCLAVSDLPTNDMTENDFIEQDIRTLRPTARQFVYNLAYFVNDSDVLQTFIDMGVMIKKWDTDREVCEFILKLDLERDVKPRLIFLHDCKIPADRHAFVIEKNPYLFQEDLLDLETRIDYLRSKRFTDENIAEIVSKAPRWLRLSVEQVDTKLGWIQNEFGLTGDQLREIVISKPKLVTLPLKIIADVRFCLKDYLNFDQKQIKHFMVKYPKLFTKDFKILEANYSYLTKVVRLTNEQLATYVPVLQAPLQLIRTRYAFLKHLDRVQFDVTKPNFVSIKHMIEPDEEKFFNKYAKCSREEYESFLKTI